MNIILNNTINEVHENITIEELLLLNNIRSRYIAVEINKRIIPKSKYKEYRLSEDDKVEIITAIGGG
jgi:sulfur carrier protein